MKNYIVANGNRRISEHDTEDEAVGASEIHNATCADLNTEQAHVCTQDEYVQQLEAAVQHVEWLHSEQKRDLKNISDQHAKLNKAHAELKALTK
jgi:hypothetical protein